MTSNIKPGIVRHVERGVGLARRTETYPDGIVITFLGPQNLASSTTLLDGWENVDVVAPGHVQVRVDDLDLDHPEGVRALWMRVQRLTADPDSHETYEEWAAANNSRCNAVLAPGHEAVDPSDVAQVTLPAEATVTLGCPECGGELEAHVWLRELQGGCHAVITPATHACPPTQPDEPTEFGAHITVTYPDGTREKWVRQFSGWWVNEDGDVPDSWADLCSLGTITLGWDE